MASYRQIHEVLRKLAIKGASGTLFLATKDNKLARVGFNNGSITSVFFNQAQANAALGELRHIQNAKLSFDRSVLQPSQSIPSTAKIIQRLAPDERDQRMVAAADEDKAGVTNKRRETLQTALVAVLGPMAQFIFDDVLALAKNDKELEELLLMELNSAEERADFLRRI